MQRKLYSMIACEWLTPPAPTYTDKQIIDATGVPIDSLRRLITWGAVRPEQAGGGRGRIRLWTIRQALRISVTAQFASVGFGLQMAHTLTYCIPLDLLLSYYDPENLAKIINKEGSREAEGTLQDSDLLELLTGPDEPTWWPDTGRLFGETIIVDGRYLYSDVYGKRSLRLMAEIDSEHQQVLPRLDLFRRVKGVDRLGRPYRSDASEIDKTSLLIDRKYLQNKKSPPQKDLPLGIPTQLGSGDLVCRSLLAINLALGFALCIRKLRNLPMGYRPHELTRVKS